MNVVKLLAAAAALSDTPSNVGSSTKVMLQHNHAGGQAHEVTVKNSSGTTLGSMWVPPHSPLIIDKESTDTVEVASGITDIYATPVAIFG